jgi:eukaryotic-like serine/threonine-protein kinase
VALSIDPREAEAVEVVVATSGSAGGATRWLVRLDQKKGTAAFGKKVGSGDFEPAGTPIPLRKKRPYVLVAYERAGDRLTAWFEAEELGGTSAAGLATTELRVDGIGKPIRIERADITERIERK